MTGFLPKYTDVSAVFVFGLGHTVQIAMFILLTEAVVLWLTHMLHFPPAFATLTTSFRASGVSLSLSLS